MQAVTFPPGFSFYPVLYTVEPSGCQYYDDAHRRIQSCDLWNTGNVDSDGDRDRYIRTDGSGTFFNSATVIGNGDSQPAGEGYPCRLHFGGGIYELTATYEGDTNYAASTFNGLPYGCRLIQ